MYVHVCFLLRCIKRFHTVVPAECYGRRPSLYTPAIVAMVSIHAVLRCHSPRHRKTARVRERERLREKMFITLPLHFSFLLIRLQLDVKDSEYGEVQRKSQLLSALRDLYSSGQVAAASVDRENSDPPNVHLDEQQINQPAQVRGHESSSTVYMYVQCTLQSCTCMLCITCTWYMYMCIDEYTGTCTWIY